MMIIFHGTHGGKDLRTLYAHRQTLAGPGPGGAVTKGDNIGSVGNTGASFGAHCHFETHECGVGDGITWNLSDNGGYRTAINPRDFMVKYGS
jgi:murein DD-endopeptidase MepM/ murein hydrolase activator NlpD